jgi:hypothetical protein
VKLTILSRVGRSRHLLPILGLAALTLLMFGDVLLTPKAELVSVEGGDVFLEDVYWRGFAFGELRHGNFPFWNPHIFSGTPFFGGFQSGLLYPLNLHYLFMPVYRAINLSIALHVFLMGLFMYLWASWRGLRRLSAFTAAALVMFSGAYFMNVFAGHLGPIGAMVWAPLVFLAIDMIFDRPTLGRTLFGTFAVAMQILADAPQYVLFTAAAAAIYTALRWLPEPNKRRRAAALAGMCALALMLTAVEVVPSLLSASESSRGGGVPYSFASEFGFPPENLLTMIAPHFFGNMVDFIYWGRCLLWEMLPSIGVIGLTLAAYGVFCGRRRARRWSFVMAAALLLLAFGRHTPLFPLIYRFVPGFNNIRGMSKFTYHMVLFLALLSGAGLDHLLRTRRVPWGLIASVAAAALLVAGLGFHLALAPVAAVPKWWVDFMQWVVNDKESLVAASTLNAGAFVHMAAETAGGGLLFAAGAFFVAGLVLFTARFFPKATPLLAALAVVEVFLFARMYMRPTFPFALTRPPVAQTAEGLTSEDRILYPERPDTAMGMGHYDIWGYGPFVSRRYAEFMAFTQGKDPDNVVQEVDFKLPHRLYVMLRARFFIREEGGRLLLRGRSQGFPYALLIQDFDVLTGRDDIFAALAAEGFDPRLEVILEKDPGFAPRQGAATGSAKVVERGTDHLIIEAETDVPTVLLVTDSFASGWRVKGLDGSAQESYEILPANYVLRGVPLSPGKHRLLMEYLPAGFRAGLALSLTGLSAMIGLAFCCLRCRPVGRETGAK